MKVRANLYAQLRDIAAADGVELDIAEGASVSDLLEQIYEKIPALRAHDKTILTAVGVEFVDRKYVPKPGDEISIMPPVQGG